jgi:hypothetical protein
VKKLERIFLYTVLSVLVFYVFLVDVKVESQEIIQQEIRARRIVIVNDAGQEVVELSTNNENNGLIEIYNKSGNVVAGMIVSEYGGTMNVLNKDGKIVTLMGVNGEGDGAMNVYNKDGKTTAVIAASKDGGRVFIVNQDGNAVAGMIANENDNGEIVVWNKSGKRIGSLP